MCHIAIEESHGNVTIVDKGHVARALFARELSHCQGTSGAAVLDYCAGIKTLAVRLRSKYRADSDLLIAWSPLMRSNPQVHHLWKRLMPLRLQL